MRRLQPLAVACLLALTVSTVTSHVFAQAASRMFATLPVNLASGVSTPVTCDGSGAGCTLSLNLIAPPTLTAGSGSAAYKMGGTLFWERLTTTNGADTDWIITTEYPLPANTLTTDGDRVEGRLLWDASATVGSKAFDCRVGYTAFTPAAGFTGGASLPGSTGAVSVGVKMDWQVTRTSNTTATSGYHHTLSSGNVQAPLFTAGGLSWTVVNNVACAVRSVTAATAGTVTLNELRVSYTPR